MSKPNRLLILSDGKPGHVNQSIAFAKHLGYEYDICQTCFKSRAAKAISYLADRCGFLLENLFQVELIAGQYSAVVSAGSETYYANRVLANKLGLKSVAIMLPQGYRLSFDLIVAQQHDNPPLRDNIISLPINLSYAEPQGLVMPEPDQRYVSIIVGGSNKNAQLEPDLFQKQLQQVFVLFPEHKFWMTTSRRTPAEIETVLKQFDFERAVYYSEEQINPIPDFLQHSDYVFLTADSTSMISEAVSFGSGNIEIFMPTAGVRRSKLQTFIQVLAAQRYLHCFENSVGACCMKIGFEGLASRFIFDNNRQY